LSDLKVHLDSIKENHEEMKMMIEQLFKGQKFIFTMMEKKSDFMKQSISVGATAFDLEAREEDVITQVDIEGFMGAMNFFIDL
jgi:hypothetical protein